MNHIINTSTLEENKEVKRSSGATSFEFFIRILVGYVWCGTCWGPAKKSVARCLNEFKRIVGIPTLMGVIRHMSQCENECAISRLNLGDDEGKFVLWNSSQKDAKSLKSIEDTH